MEEPQAVALEEPQAVALEGPQEQDLEEPQVVLGEPLEVALGGVLVLQEGLDSNSNKLHNLLRRLGVQVDKQHHLVVQVSVRQVVIASGHLNNLEVLGQHSPMVVLVTTTNKI